MALGKPKLVVVLTPRVVTDLNLIWNYNATHRSVGAADTYGAFLMDKLMSLSSTYLMGQPLDVMPNWRYVIMKKRNSGDGHIAVYRIEPDPGIVTVLQVFHTQQNWQDRIDDEQ